MAEEVLEGGRPTAQQGVNHGGHYGVDEQRQDTSTFLFSLMD